jgi:hypothetical protein
VIARACAVSAVVGLGLLLGECATYVVKEMPFVTPAPPGPNETLIYVIREDSFLGSARDLQIIDNDTVVAVLTPGTFSYFKVPTGEHEIVGYIAPDPLMHQRVSPRSGAVVYLYCRLGYASGIFMEVLDEAQAAPLMARFKHTQLEKPVKAKRDYKAYYERLYK